VTVCFLLIDRIQNLVPTLYRRLGESLTGAQLTHGTGTLKFLFVPLQRAVDGFVVFDVNDKHRSYILFLLVFEISDCKESLDLPKNQALT
jgi:hypothetical protein